MLGSAPTALVAAAPTLFRQGLLALLHERWPQLLLTLTAEAAQAAELGARRSFGLIVFDEALPGLDLPRLLARIGQARPAQRLLVLSEPRTPSPRRPTPAVPATQLLVPRHVLPQALAAALAPWLDAPADVAHVAQRPVRRLARAVASSFSPREMEVLRLVMNDHCNEEIADKLCLSVRTVESHRRTLLHKAGTRTLVGLATRAVREGWIA